MSANGQWAETPSQINQASALKWGTGVSQIHASRDNGMGRDIAPGQIQGTVETELVTETYGFSEEEASSQIWGYGIDTGTADRPGWGTEDVDMRTADMTGYPTFGQHPVGLPGGNKIRAIDKGSVTTSTSKLVPNFGDGTLYGFEGKDTSDQPFDAEISDESQYIVQTSMAQRDKVRTGSQISGTASEYNAPIKQRIPGYRVRAYSGGERHAAMLPKAQDQKIRPWWARNAGTGNPANMEPNAMYQSTPYQRTPTSDAFQGTEIGTSGVGINVDQDGPGTAYGFTSEDVTY